MIPDYLIIEEQRRKERELREQAQPIPLRIPLPMHEMPDVPPSRDVHTHDSDERGVCIIDLNTFETTRM